MAITFEARQKLRVTLQSLEFADEIVNSLNEFIDRFILINGTFSSNSWQTLYTVTPSSGQTTMVTFSVIGRENALTQAGLKRTAVFYTEDGVTTAINIQQSDFTNKSNQNFDAKIVSEEGAIKFQVKGATNNLTRWRGSVEVETLGD